MAGTVAYLDVTAPYRELGVHNVDHPMRLVTREAAEHNDWNPEKASKVSAVFDDLAPDWHNNHNDPERTASLVDALERGGVCGGRLVELGCGTGVGTALLAARRDVSAAVDLSAGMLAEADSSCAPLVRADASMLPLPDRCVDALVLLNMLLFPAETDRVLAPQGTLVWVNTGGEATPIHLSAQEVVDALPGNWTAVASRAGTGTWCVVRRG